MKQDIEKEVMPNPGFLCYNFAMNNGFPKNFWEDKICKKQCDECINKVIDHHTKSKPKSPDKI